MQVTVTEVRSILTRTSGYLTGIASHSLQPYQGCSLGRSLCGAACYVQHNGWLRRGRNWGGFLEVRSNAAQTYLTQVERERGWARRKHGTFGIFMSSSTDPFLPQESQYRLTRALLQAMSEQPPDLLIVQTHSALVEDALDELLRVQSRCRLRVHLSVETDRERIAGLPPHAFSVARRLTVAARLRAAGIATVITVAPLYPIADPTSFFTRLGECADAVVIDHFVEGDGSPQGERTRRTPVPAVMESLEPGASRLEYRDRMVRLARTLLPGRVGVGRAGFAGLYAEAAHV